jgi:hypothetical protein
MPRYFFHLRDQGEIVRDRDGLNLRDPHSAREVCRRMVREVLFEQDWVDELFTNPQFEIVDERGRTILIVPFREAERLPHPREGMARH